MVIIRLPVAVAVEYQSRFGAERPAVDITRGHPDSSAQKEVDELASSSTY